MDVVTKKVDEQDVKEVENLREDKKVDMDV